MFRIIAVPILYRLLMKLLICAIIVQKTGVVNAAGGGGGSTTDVATAATLQREVDSLQERLELFEMKHETLQAASEQFRIQSKSAKLKLDEERKRYDILASEKRSLVTGLETKLENALEDQKSVFDDTVFSEHIEEQNLLKAEKEELDEKLRLSEQQRSMIEKRHKAKLQEQNKRFELLEKKKLAADDKLRSEITDLKKRLSYSESQTESFEESWREVIAESDAKDELIQEESMKRVEEAGLWEQRINKLNADSKNLVSDLERKDDELTKSKTAHTLLLKNVRKSDERIQQHDAQIETMTAVVNDLRQEIVEKDAKTETLQNETVEIKFELDTSQSEMKQSIQEKSKLTKTYTEALNKLTTKNNGLRNIVVDTKFELENSQNQTKVLRLETTEITKAQEETLEKLESEGRKLKASRTELASSKREYEMMTDRFHEFDDKVQDLLQRIDEEATKYAEIKEALDTKGKNLVESKQNFKIIKEHNAMLQEKLRELEGKVKEVTEQLELKVSKNSYLQKTLLNTRYKLEDSQSKAKQLEEMQIDPSTPSNELLQLEIENSKITKQKYVLERELKESTTLYIGISREMNVLKDQLNATESQSTKFSNKYESLKVEKDVLGRNLRAASLDVQEKISAFEQCDKELRTVQLMHTTEAQLDKNKDAFEQCDRELRGTRTEYSTLIHEHNDAKDLINEKQAEILLQQNAIVQRKNDLTETKMKNSKLIADLAAANGSLIEAKSTITRMETSVLPQETAVVSVEKISEDESQSSNIQEIPNEESATMNKIPSHINNSTSSDPSSEDEIQSSNVQEIPNKENATMNEVPSHIDNSTSSDPSSEDEIQSSDVQEIPNEENATMNEAPSHIDNSTSSDPSSEDEIQSSDVQEIPNEENATMNEAPSHIDNSTSSDPSSEDDIQSSNVQEIQNEANDMMNEVPSHVDNSRSLNPSIENDSTSTPTPTQNTWGWFRNIVSFFRWLDYALYKILRVVVDSAGLLTNSFGKINSLSCFGWIQNGTAHFERFAANFMYMFSIVALVLNEFRIIHDALVSLFEFEMTFVSSLLSSEQDRSGFSFLIHHSNVIVIFGEVIAALLGLDFIISSFLYPRRRRKRPTAKTIEVPKTANASLLRKANNL
jgi:chromosome segregation ATPase